MHLAAKDLMVHALRTIELATSGSEIIGTIVWRGKLDSAKWNITCKKSTPMQYGSEEQVDPYECSVTVRNLCFVYWKYDK